MMNDAQSGQGAIIDVVKSPRLNLDAFMAGLEGHHDDLQFVLRYSGEGLAEAADYLRARPTGESAEMMLIIARIHAAALCSSNMPLEALRTGIMALQMLFILRINPESCGRIYVAMWLELSIFAGISANTLGDADDHFAAITDMCQGMVMACIDAYGLASDPEFGMLAEAVGSDLAERDITPTFDGRPITPYMAVDILADSYQRLAAIAPIQE